MYSKILVLGPGKSVDTTEETITLKNHKDYIVPRICKTIDVIVVTENKWPGTWKVRTILTNME